jgi:precorrin-2 methylase
MKPLDISPDFTIEDIHKIREYNYEMTKNMTRQEKMDYYKEGVKEVQSILQEMKNEEK